MSIVSCPLAHINAPPPHAGKALESLLWRQPPQGADAVDEPEHDAGAEPGGVGRGVQQDEEIHPLTLPLKALGHLEGDHAPVAVAAEKIRPMRLEVTQCGEAIGRHRLDRGRSWSSVDPVGVEDNEWL